MTPGPPLASPARPVELNERFSVSYAWPIALCALAWVITLALLAEVITGDRSRGRPIHAVTWIIYLVCALVTPVWTLRHLSGRLEVAGNRLVWKRWFGLSSLVFDRAQIREARIERTERLRSVCISLNGGPTIRFNEFASGFTRLGHYFGLLTSPW